MVSADPDGECVEVVGEDAPAGVGLLAVMALQAGPAQSVTAFEVADATLDAGAVARLAFAGASGAGFVAAGDEHARVLGDRVACRAGLEAAVADQLARPDREPVELFARVGQQRVLGRVPGRVAAGRMNPRAPRRVFSVTSAIWAT